MSVKSKVLAGAATLTLVGAGAGGLFTTGVANAATPSCQTACIDIFNDQFGDLATGHAAFLLDSFKQGVATGTPLILFRESNHDPALDFVIEDQGSVNTFNLLGLIDNQTELHYAAQEAYEIEYAPFGAATGQCMGLAATATQGEHVTLQPCGVSSKTVWIVDLIDGVLATTPFGNGGALSGNTPPGVPLINGSNVNFSHPFVLTYPSSGYPTDQPRPVLEVTNLTGFFSGVFPTVSTLTANVSSDQLWDSFTGPVQN
jgi:hypothetical protein